MQLYETVKTALLLSEGVIRAGKTGAECYLAVKDYFAESGFKSDTEGFIHSLGHGGGLEIHEASSLSSIGGELASGNVITLEPGLYYRAGD
ncbi:MAG: aminopeptidase P family protein [Methanospirillum sp.]|nr:aminopeptidase P family protein [Methanospirillum sp.]